jgi:hypothetical protein
MTKGGLAQFPDRSGRNGILSTKQVISFERMSLCTGCGRGDALDRASPNQVNGLAKSW